MPADEQIPFPDGPPTWPLEDDDVRQALLTAYESGAWGQYLGPYCDRLRERLREVYGLPHARLCASGTAAVSLALTGANVGPGDEVILASYDFKANLSNVLHAGATPVLVDVEPHDWQISIDAVAEAMTERTKAVLVSHLHGGLVDMPRLMELARERKILVIEDACQMPDAWLSGQRVCTRGDVGVISFGGSKTLSAGRGGAIVSERDDLMQRIHLYAERGNDLSPLSELQAAVLLPQLDKMDDRAGHRLRAVEQIASDLPAGLTPLRSRVDGRPGYYKLGLQYDPQAFGGRSRDEFSQRMRSLGVALDPGFRSLHRVTGSRRYRAGGALTEADRADENILVLHHPILLEAEDVLDRLIDALRSA